jgi:hypothetical protein
VQAKDSVVFASLAGNGLSGAVQAAFNGERILVTNSLGNSVSLWRATDLAPISTSPTQGGARFGACSEWNQFLGHHPQPEQLGNVLTIPHYRRANFLLGNHSPVECKRGEVSQQNAYLFCDTANGLFEV